MASQFLPGYFCLATIHKYTLLEPTFYDFASHYMSPKFCPCHQLRRKLVANSFGKRNFMESVGRLSTHSMGPDFSFWGSGWGNRDFLFSSLVPNVFPSSYHQFPKFTQCSKMHSPRCSQQHPSFIPYGMPKVHLPCMKSRGARLSLFCNW